MKKMELVDLSMILNMMNMAQTRFSRNWMRQSCLVLTALYVLVRIIGIVRESRNS